MTTWKGFGRLKTTDDLLGKMRYDYARMTEDPAQEYAAIDFFVAAEHMVDWRWPEDSAKRSEVRSHDPLATVSHLANGAKHFEVSAARHNRVRDVALESEPEAGSALLGMAMPGATLLGHVEYGPDALMITTADSRQYAAVELARMVLDYWTTELAPGGIHER